MIRPYGLGILSGIGVGLVSANGILLVAYWQGYAIGGTSGFLTWLGLFTLGLGVMLALAPWMFTEPVPVEYAEDSPPSTPSIPPTRGETVETVYNTARGSTVLTRYRPSTQIESDWIDATGDFLLWTRELGSLSGTAHVGKSMPNPNEWMEITAPLVDFGMILPKQKGVESKFAPGWDATRGHEVVMRGHVTFPERKAPVVFPLPNRRMTVDGDDVGRARPVEA